MAGNDWEVNFTELTSTNLMESDKITFCNMCFIKMQQSFYSITMNVVCVCIMNRVEINFHTFPSFFQSFTSNKKHNKTK